MKKLMFWYKLGFATVVLLAVWAQFERGFAQENFSPVNFFSFFTIESNIFAAVIFIVSAFLLKAKRRNIVFDYFRGAATLYMVITGMVYSLLLVGADVQTPIPWVNAVLHYIFPVVVLLDWLLDHPEKKIPVKNAMAWLLFPLLYGTYSLIRGPFAHDWYPYPFLNVEKLGYSHVAINALGIAIFVALLAIVIAHLPHLASKASARRALARKSR